MQQKFYILFFLFFLNYFLFAQSLKFDHITSSDGLGNNYTRKLYEDSYGFIWISTKDGLSRYDGIDVKTYKENATDSTSIPSGYVGAIQEDREKNLWIATSRGLAHYIRELDRFETILFKTADHNSMFDIILDSNTIWIGTISGLVSYNNTTKDKRYFYTKPNDYLNTQIGRMVKGKNNKLWITLTFKEGLIEFDKESNNYNIYKLEDTASSSIISSIYALNDTTILIGFLSNGLYSFNTVTKTFKKHNPSYQLNKVGITTPWSMYQDKNRNIWIGTLNGGVFKFNEQLTASEHYLPDKLSNTSLNSASISDILEDKCNNILFGTHHGGVNIINKRKNTIPHYFQTSNSYSINHDNVTCFIENDKKNEIIIGTDGGGINIFNPQKQTFRSVTGKHNKSVLSLEHYDEKTIIFTTWDGGAYLLNKNTYSIDKFEGKTSKGEPIFHNLKNTYSDANYTYLLGEYISVLHKTTFIKVEKSKDSIHLLSNIRYCNKIVKDIKGRLWISTNSGLYKFENKETTLYFQNKKDSFSILSNYVSDIFIDSDENTWFGTLSGLNLYDNKNNRFINFKQKELNSSIFSIIEDNDGCLWIATQNGIVKYNHKTKEIKTFDSSDGLQGNIFNERSVYKDSKGYLYFGGNNGFNRFLPIEPIIDTSTPTLFIKQLKLQNIPVSLNSKNSPLQKHIHFTNEILLDHNQKIITIEFIALHMAKASKNQYRYKLEGFEDRWFNSGNKRGITYTNLSPGEYLFKIMSSNADGTWNRESKTLKITITEPWWLSNWFIILCILFILSITFFLFHLRISSIHKTNRILEKKVEKRTHQLVANKEILVKEIQSKDKLFSIIAHDLKIPINNMIQNTNLLLTNWINDNDKNKLKLISKIFNSATETYNLLLNLLDWSRA